jgi:hypothetical protein
MGDFDPRCSLKMGPFQELVAVKTYSGRSITVCVGQTVQVIEWIRLKFSQISNERVARRLRDGF